jgi:F-box-like
MPRNEIPVDVLRDILDYVDKADLATMCRVSKIFCSCSQDILYRDISVAYPSRKVHQTLAQSTHLARKVRSFETNIYSDLAMALRNMTSLRILKLPSGIHMDILDGCTFKLDSFECTRLDQHGEAFAKFLSSQPSLKYLTFAMDLDPTLSLDATCLPNLTRIHVPFPWLPRLIPGRPLNEVITFPRSLNKDSIDFSFFALSTTPIQKLKIDHFHFYSTPAHLLASFLPSLTHFTLTVLTRYIVFKHEGVCGIPLY